MLNNNINMKTNIQTIIAFTIIQMLIVNTLIGQTVLTISGNEMVQSGGYLVLENTNFINSSTFHSGSGEVVITGDAANTNSAIGGTSLTTFYNLTINKTSNGAQLGNSSNVSNQLTLTSGNIDLQTYNLTIENTGTISGSSSSSYIQTTSSGTLVQEVGASNVVFPVGNQSYSPVTLNNAGTTDNFNVRVENAVYLDGTSGTAVTTDVVNATWHIDEMTSGGSDITAIFQWNTFDELTDFDRTQSFVSYYDNSTWNNGTAQAASGSNPYTLTESGITTLSQFVVVSDATALPVELLYFYAEKEGNNVRLDWETATEISNSHFDIEWSIDGINFEKIGEVAGAGTTNEIQSYDFLDDLNRVGFQNRHGLHYYRLKQVDLDGKFEYTNILSIEFESSKVDIQVYPNPASNYIVIENMEIGEAVQIFSVNGQLVKSFQIENDNQQIAITDLASGIYFIKIGKVAKKLIISK